MNLHSYQGMEIRLKVLSDTKAHSLNHCEHGHSYVVLCALGRTPQLNQRIIMCRLCVSHCEGHQGHRGPHLWNVQSKYNLEMSQ